MHTIALAIAKGGTGKTTVAVHLSVGAALMKKRTLLVDLDPQANATRWLLGSVPAGPGAAEAMTEGKITDEMLHNIEGRENLSLLCGSRALASANLKLASEPGGNMALSEALSSVKKRFDYVFLDCPPSLDLSVLNALSAADGIVAPILPAFLSIAGVRQLEETVEQLRRRAKIKGKIIGYVLFAADMREAVTREARSAIKASAPAMLLESEIRVSAAAKTLPGHTATSWDPGEDARGAKDYKAVLEEMFERLSTKRKQGAAV